MASSSGTVASTSYDVRLASFSSTSTSKRSQAKTLARWPHPPSFSVTPASLASAGFIYDPTPTASDNVTCAYCRRGLEGWEPGDDALDEHLKRKDEKTGLHCPWAAVMARKREWESGEGIEREGEEMYKARLGTFGKWWKMDTKRNWNPTSSKLALAGFHNNPQANAVDTCECLYCGISLDGWDKEDVPEDEHRRRTPDCYFFTSQEAESSPSRPTKAASKVLQASSTRARSAANSTANAKASDEPTGKGKATRKTATRSKASEPDENEEQTSDDSDDNVITATRPTKAKKSASRATATGGRRSKAPTNTRAKSARSAEPSEDEDGPSEAETSHAEEEDDEDEEEIVQVASAPPRPAKPSKAASTIVVEVSVHKKASKKAAGPKATKSTTTTKGPSRKTKAKVAPSVASEEDERAQVSQSEVEEEEDEPEESVAVATTSQLQDDDERDTPRAHIGSSQAAPTKQARSTRSGRSNSIIDASVAPTATRTTRHTRSNSQQSIVSIASSSNTGSRSTRAGKQAAAKDSESEAGDGVTTGDDDGDQEGEETDASVTGTRRRTTRTSTMIGSKPTKTKSKAKTSASRKKAAPSASASESEISIAEEDEDDPEPSRAQATKGKQAVVKSKSKKGSQKKVQSESEVEQEEEEMEILASAHSIVIDPSDRLPGKTAYASSQATQAQSTARQVRASTPPLVSGAIAKSGEARPTRALPKQARESSSAPAADTVAQPKGRSAAVPQQPATSQLPAQPTRTQSALDALLASQTLTFDAFSSPQAMPTPRPAPTKSTIPPLAHSVRSDGELSAEEAAMPMRAWLELLASREIERFEREAKEYVRKMEEGERETREKLVAILKETA